MDEKLGLCPKPHLRTFLERKVLKNLQRTLQKRVHIFFDVVFLRGCGGTFFLKKSSPRIKIFLKTRELF
jgi:hypothetical protein